VKFEGHCQDVPKQVEVLKQLVSKSWIKNVLEIGFNAGHSAEVLLQTNPNIKLTSFDLGAHKYVKIGKEYIDKTYPKRHTLILGDSRKTLPEFVKNYKGEKFDMIFVDGGHQYDVAKSDLINCRKLANKRNIVIMDDIIRNPKLVRDWNEGPNKSWGEGKDYGMIEETEQHDYASGRGDAVGRYIV